jgi:pimeloyl-ACP methyl ester carboxylesterase
VLLHEGLGCAGLWRDFPARLHSACGLPVVAYSRAGYGRSDVVSTPREAGFMHREAIEVLPAVLGALGLERPLLVGHSDGASIALIHAGRFPRAVAGVVAMAPHLFVEPVCLEAIAAIRARFPDSELPQRMARWHADAARTFYGWADVWLSAPFRDWNIEAEVAASRCPVLAIQGTDDEYGTLEQVRRIERLRPGTELLVLEGCRHSPHLDRPDAVLSAVAGFARLHAGAAATATAASLPGVSAP